MTCSAFWHKAAVPLLPLEIPWYVDVIKPKSPQQQFKWPGASASFDNILNKLQLKKLKNEGLNVPPPPPPTSRCVKQMYLGPRAGSHSPRYTSLANFAQMILNCCVALACFGGWGRGSFQLWICVTERISNWCGVLELFREGRRPLLASPAWTASISHPKPRPAAPGLRLPVGTKQEMTSNSALPHHFHLCPSL